MLLPTTRPEHDSPSLWRVQTQLITLAETLLGPRDSTKIIYQPAFNVAGPRLVNTPPLDGAFAELSMNSAGYWPTAVFELAHETVHLLNPTIGYTNWFEEGVAVAFSLHALEAYSLPLQPIGLATYREALELVQALPGGPFMVAKKARALAKELRIYP